MPGGREVGCERAQTRVVDRVGEGARVRRDGAEGFRVVRDRCLRVVQPGYMGVTRVRAHG